MKEKQNINLKNNKSIQHITDDITPSTNNFNTHLHSSFNLKDMFLADTYEKSFDSKFNTNLKNTFLIEHQNQTFTTKFNAYIQ